MSSFEDLKISAEICELLKRQGIVTPTAVQERVIPQARAGKDLIVQSKTGTGKTLAFLLPTIERLKKISTTQELIIAPTRELATQISKVAETICATVEIESLLICGGQDIDRQKEKLRRVPQIIIGTPGRLLDHLRRGTIQLKNVNKIVVDEADELLKLGFIEDVENLLRETAKDRQIILCSATMPLRIRQLAAEFLKNPKEILVEPKVITLENINQVVVKIPADKKFSKLVEILQNENPYLAMIFCAKKETTSHLALELAKKNFEVDELHGDLTQQQRNFVLKKFREAKIQILVATDIAARGLDIEGVTHVISYDIPRDVETYIHRIGRTGRAGEKGSAITLVTENEIEKLRRIERGIKKSIAVKRTAPKNPRAKQIKKSAPKRP
ncbi:MAG: DEAD/DEAH box helicase [Selenomonadaceae bacterium]|nr:DEAD/DEAH box helicase [Selenomonadaceae bacterium]